MLTASNVNKATRSGKEGYVRLNLDDLGDEEDELFSVNRNLGEASSSTGIETSSDAFLQDLFQKQQVLKSILLSVEIYIKVTNKDNSNIIGYCE